MALRLEKDERIDVPFREAELGGGRIEDDGGRSLGVKPAQIDGEVAVDEDPHIVVTNEKIELKQKIFFDTDKATIQPRSFGLLDEIGNVLKSRPTMTVRIEGHTDSRGTRKHNMALSAARAESVRQHLVGLGIDSSRMDPKGYGPDQPIETNKTAAGREKNRRVEFFITQQ